MPYFIAVYDWSLYTIPTGISTTDLEGDTQGASWVGETFTFNGGTSTLLAIDDDDTDFEDGYVETGGSQTLDQDTVINGTTYLAGAVIENELGLVDASGNEVWVVRIDGVNIGFTYPAEQEPTAGETFTGTIARDGAAADSDDGQATTEAYVNIVCFAPGACIATPIGPRAIEMLKVGGLVETADHGTQAIKWISHRTVVFDEAAACTKPIEIKAGALTAGVPDRDMIVSPQHCFLFLDVSDIPAIEVLVPAKALTELPRIREMSGKKSVEYIHIAFERHELIRADSALTESCYVGRAVISDLRGKPLDRLFTTFPQIEHDVEGGYGPTARPVLRVQQARRKIAEGHLVYRKKCARHPLQSRVCVEPLASSNALYSKFTPEGFNRHSRFPADMAT